MATVELKNIHITLEACRINARLKQSELAEMLGVTLATISNWENGKGEPSLSQLRKISEISGIPMDCIFVPNDSIKMNSTM